MLYFVGVWGGGMEDDDAAGRVINVLMTQASVDQDESKLIGSMYFSTAGYCLDSWYCSQRR